ncbi:hypothetical protein O3G_MSEX004812 [Manduca sexta]|uniref:Uncharacterized protein n=1 Tax=Manduca sexta TaxID=7130 RepID=A0A921YX09_MANSE|nr:hypothetical protein O3G_MSEX004812 [Manduca sexta]KAG6447194.1 hypothetical protein O3G_MSEX004812 [Manduca sexta]
MAAKIFFVLFIQAVLSKAVLSQCIGAGFPGPYGPGFGFDGLAYDGLGLAPFDAYGMGPYDAFPLAPFDMLYGPTWPGMGCGAPLGLGPFGPATAPGFGAGYGYGGPLPIAAGSPMPPAGLSIVSENVIEGVVSVAGQLPFLSAISMAGEFPTAGSGAVSYGCGDGGLGIVAEIPMGPAVGPIMEPIMAPAMAPFEYAAVGPYGYGPVVDGLGYGPIGGCGYGAYY